MLLTESRQLKDPRGRLYTVMSECFAYKSQEETLTPDSAEGPDDMPAHIKSALIGASVTIPIKDGKLVSASQSLVRP